MSLPPIGPDSDLPGNYPLPGPRSTPIPGSPGIPPNPGNAGPSTSLPPVPGRVPMAPPGASSGYQLPPPGYAPMGAAPQSPPRTNGYCIASLVMGILGIFLCCTVVLSVAAIVCGIVGRNKVAANPQTQTGAGLGLAGIILGGFGLLIFVGLLTAGNLNFNTTLR